MAGTKFVVYQITYIPTSQYYVGSTGELKKRWDRHRREMKSGKHHNARMLDLLVSGYDPIDWAFAEISAHGDEVSAKVEEERLIKLGRRSLLCLNIGKHATGGDNLTAHPRRAEIMVRRIDTQRAALDLMTAEERRAKWGKSGDENGMHGRRHTEKSRHAMAAALKGHSHNKGCKRSDATRALMSKIASTRTGESNPFFGREHSDETKAKLSEANKGRRPPNLKSVRVEGKVYEGVTDAARAIGVSPPLVIYRIKSEKWDYHYL